MGLLNLHTIFLDHFHSKQLKKLILNRAYDYYTQWTYVLSP